MVIINFIYITLLVFFDYVYIKDFDHFIFYWDFYCFFITLFEPLISLFNYEYININIGAFGALFLNLFGSFVSICTR